MLEVIQNAIQSLSLDGGTATFAAVACACLCGILFVLGFILQFIGGALEIVLNVFGLFFDILSGGPVAWCGCLVAMCGLCGCGFFLLSSFSLFSTCGTPEQINLCRLFGF
jgi:hypothetical protein